jgi:hypothetical protein
MACPPKSFPSRVRLDTIRAARKIESCASDYEGQGEGAKGGQGGRPTGAPLSRSVESPQLTLSFPETDNVDQGEASSEGGKGAVCKAGREDAQEEGGEVEAQGEAQ